MNFLGRGGFLCHLALFFIISFFPAGLLSAQNITLNGLSIDMTSEEDNADQEKSNDKTINAQKKWIVQFTGPIHDNEKSQLIDLGCRIHDYIPDFAFIVSMDDSTWKEVENFSFIEAIVKYRPEHKIRKTLKKNISEDQSQPGTRKKIHIRTDSVDHLPLLLADVKKQGGKILDVGHDVTTVEISAAAVNQLAELEEVLWIEEVIDLQLCNDTSRWTIQTYEPYDTKIWDMGIRGEGQIIGISDTGLDYDMPWFHDPENIAIGPGHRKVIGYMAYADDYDGDFGHGTHVACTAAGDRTPVDGSSEANGMAPMAKLFIQDITPGEQNSVYPPSDLGSLFITPYTSGAHVHSNSWGSAVNIYNTYARSTDQFMWDHKDFLAVFSNGNSGTSDGSMGTPATAKNAVSVGAAANGVNAENLAVFSSNGPTEDGRIKPTVSAPGVAIVSADSDGIKDSFNDGTIAYSGTSMATPTVAGAAALVRQYYQEGYWPYGSPNPSDGFEPSAALIKATLINSAQNMNGEYTDGPIPSNGQGWGRINLANTLHFYSDSNFLNVADVANGLSTGTTWSRRYFATGNQHLKATLVWTDYPGMEGAAKDLVNDLDLLVTTPEGITYRGNVFDNGLSVDGGTADNLNVVEQVFIPTFQSGDYTITVIGSNIPFGPQPFALVVTGAEHISSTGFITLDKAKYNHENIVRIRVVDRDLNVNGSATESVSININSSTEPGGEVVHLVENGTDSSIFTGFLSTGSAPATAGNGILEIIEGDTITAVYYDADDGTGKSATVTATAVADLTPPEITGTKVVAVGQDFARISWITDEPISASVSYGENQDNLANFQADPWLLTSPVVRIGGMKENTTYYYKVSSTDEAGNISEDDNNGLLYTLTTLNLPPDLTVYSSNFTETYGTETVLYGTAADPSGIKSVRITGSNIDQYAVWRSSDGYYELQVPLQIGENPFTVEATDTLGNSRVNYITVTRHEQPDLIITSVTAPELGGFAQPVHIENTICNNGPGMAPGTGFISWYLSPDSEISSSQDIKLKMEYYYEDYILPGECISLPVDIRLSLPIILVWNSYYLGAYVDSRDTVWESDETNNIGVAGSRIFIEGADLAITELSGPAYIDHGESFSVLNTVQNLGIGTSPPFGIIFYLSTDNDITANDIQIGSRNVYPLEPIDTPYWWFPSISSDATGIVLRSTVPDGIYYLGAIADPDYAFYESDKKNNVFVGNIIRIGETQDSEPPDSEPPDTEPPDNEVPDTSPPTVPQNLVAVAFNNDTVFLNWDAASDPDGSGVAGYLIYRNGIEIGNAIMTTYTDENLDAGKTYIYHIAAYDKDGNLSDWSAPAEVTFVAVSSGRLPLSIYYILLRPERKR